MELLERESYIVELGRRFSNLSGGNGLVVLISGEAGIGKTSLVESFINRIKDKANILWGACDALFVPRPLGPVYDMAAQMNGKIIKLLNEQTSRSEIFNEFFFYLKNSPVPNIVIIEDVHWADESTLDFIKFLSRRSSRISSMFLITYRDDELNSRHPLRQVLGDIPARDLFKIMLPPLSERTVNDISMSSGIKNLYEITGGNPFLISELLGNKDNGIPSTIKDSVLTKISRLSESARDLIEMISIIPTKVEKWLIDELMPDNHFIQDECFQSGILRIEESALTFRHELTRQAVEESLSEIKKLRYNDKVLQILLNRNETDNYLARIIHHASKSHNKEIIIKYAPVAAMQASKLGAHSLAAEHYFNALRYVNEVPPSIQINLYEGRSYECFLTGQVQEGIKAGLNVIELLKKNPDPEREAENYRRMSRMLWYDCKDIEGEEYLDKAIGILEKLPISKNYAMACSNKSQTYAIREEYDEAIKWGEKALKLAEQINDPEIETHALNNIGCSKMILGDEFGEKLLKKSLEISLQNKFAVDAARAYTNLGSICLEQRKLDEADNYFTAGAEYCNAKDVYVYSLCLAGHHSKVKLHWGKWDEAAEVAGNVLKRENLPTGNKVMPMIVTGLIRARRNDPGAMELLDEANHLAWKMGEGEKITAVGAARAEAYWLQNRLHDLKDELKTIFEHVKKSKNPWATGEIAFWLWKAGGLTEIPDCIALPFLQHIKGDWKSAAETWERLGCPYESALALTDGDINAYRRSIEIFDSLGASAALQLIKQKMRESGVKGIPKGPRRTTQKNPAGLTTRQLEVLNLISKGLSNNEISYRLYISPKTVDHHVSTILSKLNIRSRNEAAAYYHLNGISEK